jgi:septal ring factor EnvC (AmiA/AmiB activator)
MGVEQALGADAGGDPSPSRYGGRSMRDGRPALNARRALRAKTVVGVFSMLLSTLFVTSAHAARDSDPRAERSKVRAERAQQLSQIDSLTASREDLAQALAQLSSDIDAQELDVADSIRESAVAQQAVLDARAAEAAKRAEVEQSQVLLSSLVLQTFVQGASSDALGLSALTGDPNDSLRYGLSQLSTLQMSDELDRLGAATEDLELARSEAEAAERVAQQRQAAQEQQLADLQVARDAKAQIVNNVEDELDRALSEAASLEQLDAELSAQILADQAALAAKLQAAQEEADARARAEAERVAAEKAAADKAATDRAAADRAAAEKAAADANVPPPPAPAAPRPAPVGADPTPGNDAPPAPPTQGSMPPGADVQVASAGKGITVNVEIVEQVSRLLVDADAAGINLSGGGYRSAAGQIATRRANCGPSDYDIYEKPASACRPPTARPGRSMHEQGRAIDFTCDGALIRSRSSPCFVWLSNNAVNYGLYNLPSEPWHWSTNGR